MHLKNEAICQLRSAYDCLEDKNADLRSKLSQKDDSIQKISTELQRCQTQYQAKSKECQQNYEFINKLESSLTSTERELEEVKRALQNEVNSQKFLGLKTCFLTRIFIKIIIENHSFD